MDATKSGMKTAILTEIWFPKKKRNVNIKQSQNRLS